MPDDGTASTGTDERSSGTVGGQIERWQDGGGGQARRQLASRGSRHARERESEARDERAMGGEGEEGKRDSQLGRPAAWQKENRTGRRWRRGTGEGEDEGEEDGRQREEQARC